MYLSQEWSAFLFTILRLALLTSSIFLISRLASRTYNLTYLERINGGFLDRVNYLLFTKFPSRRQQYLGRIYVALALFISTVLTCLPTYLSKLYPVENKFLEHNEHPFDFPIRFTKSFSVLPGNTSTLDILRGMDVSLDGMAFVRYSNSTPPVSKPCRILPENNEFVLCGSPAIVIEFKHIYDGIFPKGQSNFTLPTGEVFFDLPFSGFYNRLGAVLMFENVAFSEYNPDPYGPRLLEWCLTQRLPDKRCIRTSLGYMFEPSGKGVESKQIVLVSRKVIYERTWIGTSQGPQKDCEAAAWPSIQAMCRQLYSLDKGGVKGRMFSIHKRTNDMEGNFHFDVVTKIFEYDSVLLNIEVFSLDVQFRLYEPVFNNEDIETSAQEVFETAYLEHLDNDSDRFDHSWTKRGFSDADKTNLVSFLFGGTRFNNATLIVRDPWLVAEVSDIVVGLLFGASLVMVLAGLVISHGIPSLVRDPISEVIREVLASKNIPVDKKNSTFSFQKHRVANLVLDPQPMEDLESNNNNNTDTSTIASSRSTKPTLSPLSQRTFVLRMELDSEDEDETVELLERMNHKVNQSIGQ
ncbi:hypothetical protein BGZ96_005702 [Linnemannia gamsii]|uniref:Uncharacterized protein n=1 Tax=Linnemannia gamsii TaxID=64522 RepID=A0ABQ7KHJ2_9FUNG|nr:hypothetical protein BGZ96_005702 [Linnemannia gamsii]